MGTVVQLKETREAPRAARSSMETLILSREAVERWQKPPFQRELRVTPKVLEVMETMKKTETIEGIVTLGQIAKGSKDHAIYPGIYIVDGMHRSEAFKISELQEVIADVRVMTFDAMADMADEFVKLNSYLRKLTPDDMLRGMEAGMPLLRLIRLRCEFVGYDRVRMGPTSPLLSMSVVIKCWAYSRNETPTRSGGAGSTITIAQGLEANEVGDLINFLTLAEQAWGRDHEYYRLWGSLNLTLCMWLYRQIVLDKDRLSIHKRVSLNGPQFKRCMIALSAASDYIDWLQGRGMTDRDRAPCYRRLSSIVVKAAQEQGINKPMMPRPAWAKT